MTPAIKYLQTQKIPFSIHEYDIDPTEHSYGLGAAKALNVSPHDVFKTLVVSLVDNNFAVAIIPVSKTLRMKSMAKALGAKKADMAEGWVVERMTGYVLGGISPLGQKKPLVTIIDLSAKDKPTIYVSGGKRGLEIEISPTRLGKCLLASFENIIT